MDEPKIAIFKVTGGFDIDDKLVPILSHDGSIRGYTLPDGRKVSLVVALEVMPEDESSTEYVTSEVEMCKLGFSCLDYDHLTFFEN